MAGLVPSTEINNCGQQFCNWLGQAQAECSAAANISDTTPNTTGPNFNAGSWGFLPDVGGTRGFPRLLIIFLLANRFVLKAVSG